MNSYRDILHFSLDVCLSEAELCERVYVCPPPAFPSSTTKPATLTPEASSSTAVSPTGRNDTTATSSSPPEMSTIVESEPETLSTHSKDSEEATTMSESAMPTTDISTTATTEFLSRQTMTVTESASPGMETFSETTTTPTTTTTTADEFEFLQSRSARNNRSVSEHHQLLAMSEFPRIMRPNAASVIQGMELAF